ncbi:hypothetical protein LCGC14_0312660, partial [marine sediment metagenome]
LEERRSSSVRGLLYPLELRLPFNGRWSMSQPWGYDPTYIGNQEHFHYGLDWALWSGTPVLAAAPGKVTMLLENHKYLGNYVRLDHGNGLETGYAHLSWYSVEYGKLIEEGQEIGRSGATGLVSGAHLHWECLASRAYAEAHNIPFPDGVGVARIDPSLLLGSTL